MELIKKQNNGFLKVSEQAGPPWIGIRDLSRDPKSQDPKDSRNTRVQTAQRSTDHNHREARKTQSKRYRSVRSLKVRVLETELSPGSVVRVP